MIKLLFFDYQELEKIEGFTRKLEQPEKSSKPLFIADKSWENNNMQLYGSVIKPLDKPFQMWYSVIHKPLRIYLAYAESKDGCTWQRPQLNIYEHEGKKTNIVNTDNPHGPAILYDMCEPDPRFRYKMLCGADPSGLIFAYHSRDGIEWYRMFRYPVISTIPDCPMGLFQARDGRYVAFHRIFGCGRRVWRSESWDFQHWSNEPRLILEPDATDDCQIQFYGFGSAAYGDYEIGTLWMYHTDPDDMHGGKANGFQETELTYSRSGYAVHRTAPGRPFIPHGRAGSWDQGNLQCASQPVFLKDEIRYYYMGTERFHGGKWELEPQIAGLGYARLKPDRFVALKAGREEAFFMTIGLVPVGPQLFVNATTKQDGWVRVEVLDDEAKPVKPMEGFTLQDSIPISGDSTGHEIRWKRGDFAKLAKQHRIRIRLHAKNARVYSIFNIALDEKPVYHKFNSLRTCGFWKEERKVCGNLNACFDVRKTFLAT